MDIIEILEELRLKAWDNTQFRQMLLNTCEEENPLEAFCKKCQELGYPVYEMDLIQAGEEFYASMRRSTNGGGENSPKLDGEDDFYELFIAGLRTRNEEKA